MGEINIAARLVQERHKRGISQEELAAYMGVSKAAVSKWENQQSYPDITLLPQLATYFDISIDELMNYEPQLTKEEISRQYFRLANRFAKEEFQSVMEDCEEMIRKYYSCYPFLMQMAVLLMNHAGHAMNPTEVMQRSVELLQRVRQESDHVGDAKEAAVLEATCHMMLQENQEALELLDEDLRPMSQEMELLAQVYQHMGNVDKAKTILQIAMYQHLLMFIGDSSSYIMLYGNDYERAETMIQRTGKLAHTYEVDKLHPNVMSIFYISAAQVYAMNQRREEALKMLEHYTRLCVTKFLPFELHGDDYFDQMDSWFADFELGKQAPRSGELIAESMVQSVRDNPCFNSLHEIDEYQELIRQLETFAKTYHANKQNADKGEQTC